MQTARRGTPPWVYTFVRSFYFVGISLAIKRKEELSGLLVNGKAVTAGDYENLLTYLEKAGYLTDRIAVELNKNVVPREEYAKVRLCENDVLEVVSFVGGG